MQQWDCDQRSQAQLARIQENRAQRVRVVSAGVLIKRLAERIRDRSFGPASEVASIVAELVDDEFRRHCRVAAVRAGRVDFSVDRGNLVWPMRVRWAEKLTAELATRHASRSIRGITFRFGRGGVEVKVPTGR